MKVFGFNEAVAAVVEKDPRFRPEGYQFLHESLEAILKKRSKGKHSPVSPHVTANELLEGFRTQALKEFGPMASTVLDYWGISCCRDIGQMVFYLVEAGAFGTTEKDSIQDFETGFDFYEAFVLPFLPPSLIPKDSVPSSLKNGMITP